VVLQKQLYPWASLRALPLLLPLPLPCPEPCFRAYSASDALIVGGLLRPALDCVITALDCVIAAGAVERGGYKNLPYSFFFLLFFFFVRS
jgi:hypothetical protein